MKTAAIILYVIQAVAILCAIITGQEFIDFSSGPALFETIGFFSPAILGAILEMIANNKKQKAGGVRQYRFELRQFRLFHRFLPCCSQSRSSATGNPKGSRTAGNPKGSGAARNLKEEFRNHCDRSKVPARYRPFRSVLPQMRNETKRRKRFLHRLRFKDRTITAAEPTPTVYPQRRSGSRKAHLANIHTSNHQRLANAGLFSFVFHNYFLMSTVVPTYKLRSAYYSNHQEAIPTEAATYKQTNS